MSAERSPSPACPYAERGARSRARQRRRNPNDARGEPNTARAVPCGHEGSRAVCARGVPVVRVVWSRRAAGGPLRSGRDRDVDVRVRRLGAVRGRCDHRRRWLRRCGARRRSADEQPLSGDGDRARAVAVGRPAATGGSGSDRGRCVMGDGAPVRRHVRSVLPVRGDRPAVRHVGARDRGRSPRAQRDRQHRPVRPRCRVPRLLSGSADERVATSEQPGRRGRGGGDRARADTVHAGRRADPGGEHGGRVGLARRSRT